MQNHCKIKPHAPEETAQVNNTQEVVFLSVFITYPLFRHECFILKIVTQISECSQQICFCLTRLCKSKEISFGKGTTSVENPNKVQVNNCFLYCEKMFPKSR